VDSALSKKKINVKDDKIYCVYDTLENCVKNNLLLVVASDGERKINKT
jgi:hypothetical protein